MVGDVGKSCYRAAEYQCAGSSHFLCVVFGKGSFFPLQDTKKICVLFMDDPVCQAVDADAAGKPRWPVDKGGYAAVFCGKLAGGERKCICTRRMEGRYRWEHVWRIQDAAAGNKRYRHIGKTVEDGSCQRGRGTARGSPKDFVSGLGDRMPGLSALWRSILPAPKEKAAVQYKEGRQLLSGGWHTHCFCHGCFPAKDLCALGTGGGGSGLCDSA